MHTILKILLLMLKMVIPLALTLCSVCLYIKDWSFLWRKEVIIIKTHGIHRI